MRPPWIEATALLAAAGYRVDPTPLTVIPEYVMPRLEAMPFALIKSPRIKPRVFNTLRDLARRIHAERGSSGLELDPRLSTIYPPGLRQGLVCVRVYRLGLEGAREADIGYAWLGGGEASREQLQGALEAQRPPLFIDPAFQSTEAA